MATFEVFETDSDAFRWRLRADDSSVLATSDGSYPTRQAAMTDVQRVKRAAPDAGVESVDVDAA